MDEATPEEEKVRMTLKKDGNRLGARKLREQHTEINFTKREVRISLAANAAPRQQQDRLQRAVENDPRMRAARAREKARLK
jgi:hypothetical protein